jgi:hypothetical protein
MITVTPQEEDILAAVWMRRKRLFTGKMGLLLWSGVASVLLIGGALIIVGPRYGIVLEPVYWLLGVYGSVWALAGLHWALTPIRVKRLYKKLKLADRPYTLAWDDEKFMTEDRNTRSVRPWTDFTRWYEDRRIFMLYFQHIRVTFVPKRVFTDTASLEHFRRLLQEKIGPEGVTRK